MTGSLLMMQASTNYQHTTRNRMAISTLTSPSDAPSRSINSLPVEVLGSIFYYTVKSYPLPRSYLAASSFLPPLRLSHVCHHWRTIVEATPRLWTCVVLRDRYGGAAFSQELLEQDLLVLDLFTRRSADLPLELSVLHDYHAASGDRATLTRYNSVLRERLVPSLCNAIRRCTVLHIDTENFAGTEIKSLIMDAIKQSTGMLDLSIGAGSQPRTTPDSALIARLRALRVTTISPFKRAFDSIASSSLRLLHIRDGTSGVDLLEVCHCLANLEELEIKLLDHFLPGEQEALAGMDIEVLPALNHLVLTMYAGRGTVGPWSILRNLKCPLLQSLELTVRGPMYHEHVTKLTPFISGSHSLRSFKFWGDQPPFPDASLLLERSERLQWLSINWPTNATDATGEMLLECLTATDADDPAVETQQLRHCPHLRHVELLGGICDIIPLELLTAFLVVRTTAHNEEQIEDEQVERGPHGFALREVKLEIRRSAELLEHPDVARCKDCGLQLSIVNK